MNTKRKHCIMIAIEQMLMELVGDSGYVDHPKQVQAEHGIPVYVDLVI